MEADGGSPDTLGTPANNGATNNTTQSNAVSAPTTQVAVKYAFGCCPTKNDSLLSFSEGTGSSVVQGKKKGGKEKAKEREYSDRLVYKVGKKVCVFDPETASQDFFTVNPYPTNKRGGDTANNEEKQASVIVYDIVHFTMCSNSRYLSVCEVARDTTYKPHGEKKQ